MISRGLGVTPVREKNAILKHDLLCVAYMTLSKLGRKNHALTDKKITKFKRFKKNPQRIGQAEQLERFRLSAIGIKTDRLVPCTRFEELKARRLCRIAHKKNTPCVTFTPLTHAQTSRPLTKQKDGATFFCGRRQEDAQKTSPGANALAPSADGYGVRSCVIIKSCSPL